VRVERLGSGEPSVAVVGGIHGDEPCGVRAVEHLLEADLDLRGSVTLVIANELAIDRDVRYVEEDLNRAFPPMGASPAEFAFSESHEGRLARRLYDLLSDTLTLSIHSTQSYPDPFGVLVENEAGFLEPEQVEVCSRLPIESVVDSSALSDGRMLEALPTVEIEAGYQKSAAATANAIEIAQAFLAATGVVEGRTRPSPRPVYRIVDRIPKPAVGEYEVFVGNFELVEAGETFAAVDGEPVVAEAAFYPVLLSERGYDDIFGYTAEHVGTTAGSFERP
jgi:predicted deacylase